MGSLKNVSQIGSAVWPAIANIYKYIYVYMSEELYYIDISMWSHIMKTIN